MTENEIGKITLDSAFAVHRGAWAWATGGVYEVVLAAELLQRGLSVERQVPVPIRHKG